MEKTSEHLSIKHWTASERPRERLLKNGVSSLSDAELLAILLRTGIRGQDAVSLSRELIEKFGGLRGLLSADIQTLVHLNGVGPAKASALAAAIEITKRQLRENLTGRNALREPRGVLQYLSADLRDKKKEVFKVLFLNKANHIIGERDLFEGTIDETAVYPREIVKAALDFHATGVILVHNHPSGRNAPSPEDKAITEKIRSACELVSIKVLDHLIIAGSNYFSFKESGWLQ